MEEEIIKRLRKHTRIGGVKSQVTYLLGAGSSAETIPVLNELRTRMQDILAILNDRYQYKYNIGGSNFPKEDTNCLGQIISEMTWLLDESGTQHTIDTLAKKFYLVGELDSLNKLKRSMVVYFIIEQLISYPVPKARDCNFIKNPIDKRYDSFIASIAKRGEKGFELNPSVKVITWNYDLQIELAIKRFIQKSIYNIKSDFQILPNVHTMKQKGGKAFMNLDQFGAVKLNGNALWDLSHINHSYSTLFDKWPAGTADIDLLLADIIQDYKRLFPDSTGSILHFNFAWEQDNRFEDKYEGYDNNLLEAEDIAAETRYLVVIGYSFPVFNREVDRRILNKMHKLEKIYIQDKNSERIASTIKNAFKLPLINGEQISIQEEKNLDQFVIPYELTLG